VGDKSSKEGGRSLLRRTKRPIFERLLGPGSFRRKGKEWEIGGSGGKNCVYKAVILLDRPKVVPVGPTNVINVMLEDQRGKTLWERWRGGGHTVRRRLPGKLIFFEGGVEQLMSA